jgi:hypoxanthine-guanine phosphoribosyltransferase
MGRVVVVWGNRGEFMKEKAQTLAALIKQVNAMKADNVPVAKMFESIDRRLTDLEKNYKELLAEMFFIGMGISRRKNNRNMWGRICGKMKWKRQSQSSASKKK